MAVLLTRRAEKDLRRVGPGKDLNRLSSRLTEIDIAMVSAGKPPSTKALKATHRGMVLSTRTGDYRILWVIDGAEAVVVRVIHRSDLDRVADSL